MSKKEKIPTHTGRIVYCYGWHREESTEWMRLFVTPKRYRSEAFNRVFSREGKDGRSYATTIRDSYSSNSTYLLLDTVREITREEHHAHFQRILEHRKGAVVITVENLNKAKQLVTEREADFTAAEQAVADAMAMVELADKKSAPPGINQAGLERNTKECLCYTNR